MADVQSPTDEGWALQAGVHDPAALTASLVPPGMSVALGLGAPLGVEPVLAARGCAVVATADADVIVGGASDLIPGRPGILVAPNLDHGSVLGGASPESGALSPSQLEEAIASSGFDELARVRTFAPFAPVGAAAARQTDPRAWVHWHGVLLGPPALAPPPPQPDHVPARSVMVLATEAFGQWELSRRRTLLALNDVVRQAGATLVLSWTELRLTSSFSAHADLARAGIVLHGGDGVFDVEGRSAAVAEPGTRALVNAYQPDVLLVMDSERIDVLLAVAAAEVPLTRMFGVDLDGPGLEDGIPSALLAKRVARELAHPCQPGAPDIAVVEPRERRPGVTSVVIPVHGRWDLTSTCLDSLRANTGQELEIIVVDNASPDETGARLAEMSDVTTITCATNLGFAGGTNVGLQAATGEHVCLLNNDTEVVPGWLDAMLEALAVPGAGVVGPRSNSISGMQVILDAPTMDDPAAARRWGEEQARHGRGVSWRIQRLVGFAMLLRGDLLEEVGALDQAVGLGNYEDDDFCQRVRRTGRHLRVADGSVVLHHGSATFLDADISSLQTARQGARHLGDRLIASSDLLVARIVADAPPESVEVVVSTVRAIADHVVVVCPGASLPHHVRTAYVNARTVSIVHGDPDELRVPTKAMWVLHLDSRSPIDHAHWGRVRAEVETLPRQLHVLPGLANAVLEPVHDGTVGPRPPVTADAVATNVIRAAPTA